MTLRTFETCFFKAEHPGFPTNMRCSPLDRGVSGHRTRLPLLNNTSNQALAHWQRSYLYAAIQANQVHIYIHTHIHSFVGCLSLNYLGRMVSWCGPVHPIKLPRHVQIVSSYGQDDHPLCVCVRSCDIVIYYVYIHKRTYMHATPQNKTVFFLQFVCSSLEMHQPTFWLYQLLEKHCVDSIAGETLCGLYPYIYIFVYIYTVYIYICILCICICIC